MSLRAYVHDAIAASHREHSKGRCNWAAQVCICISRPLHGFAFPVVRDVPPTGILVSLGHEPDSARDSGSERSGKSRKVGACNPWRTGACLNCQVVMLIDRGGLGRGSISAVAGWADPTWILL